MAALVADPGSVGAGTDHGSAGVGSDAGSRAGLAADADAWVDGDVDLHPRTRATNDLIRGDRGGWADLGQLDTAAPEIVIRQNDKERTKLAGELEADLLQQELRLGG